MKQALLLVLICHFFSMSLAQSLMAPNFLWVKTITLPNAVSGAEVFDFYTDSTGNSYVYGIFTGSIDFGNGTFLHTQNALEGYFVAKYLPTGGLDWARKIVASNGGIIYSEMVPSGIAADGAGNVYLCGQLSNVALNFGNGTVLQRSCVGTPTCSDIFIAKYNADGEAQWARQAAGSANTFQKAACVVVGADGTVFVVGNYEGQQLNFDNLLIYNNLDDDGMYLARYRPDGTVISTTFFGNGDGNSQVEHLAITRQNNLLATGQYTDEGLQFGNDVSLDVLGGNSTSNYFIVEYTAEGLAQWAYNLHSDAYLDVLDIAADTFGQPYVIADFTTSVMSGLELVSATSMADSSAGVLLHLTDSVFVPVVMVEYSGPAYPLANLAVDRHNRFFAAGYISEAQVAVADTVLFNAGCDDALLLSGTTGVIPPLNWVRTAGGNDCEAILSAYFGRTLATDYKGDLYMVGSFDGLLQLDNFAKLGLGLFVAKLGTGTVGTHDSAWADLAFHLSPNPSRGDFHLEVAALGAPRQVMIYDAQGSLYHQRSIRQANDLYFRLSLPNGLYTVVLLEKNGMGRQKLLIIK